MNENSTHDTTVIAIDGPAGAGKSTVAERVADHLGFQLVDTGALYRTVALASLEADIPEDAAGDIARVAESLDLEYRNDGGDQGVLYCNGELVGDDIRTPDVTERSSVVSSYPEVREALLDLQRSLGRKHSAVFEGRDIGTVVFPDADVKVFLTADARERARRRLDQIEGGGEIPEEGLDRIETEIERRDRRDRERDIAPLKKADDAVDIDSTDLTIQEVVDRIVDLVDDA
jgi:cytidylate kinase